MGKALQLFGHRHYGKDSGGDHGNGSGGDDVVLGLRWGQGC